MNHNQAYLMYPDTDYYILLRFLIDSSQYLKKVFRKVQNKLKYHENMYQIELRKCQDWKKEENFVTMSILKILEYFISSSKRLDL